MPKKPSKTWSPTDPYSNKKTTPRPMPQKSKDDKQGLADKVFNVFNPRGGSAIKKRREKMKKYEGM